MLVILFINFFDTDVGYFVKELFPVTVNYVEQESVFTVLEQVRWKNKKHFEGRGTGWGEGIILNVLQHSVN